MAQKEQKKDTEKAILEAAKKIFIEKGYTGARMQAIADEAKINKAMLHYYFRNKESLFNRILDGALEIMASQFIPAFSGEGSVMEKVERLISGYTEAITNNPYIPMFVLNELSQNREKFQEDLNKKLNANMVFPKLITQIEQEQKQGILKKMPPHHIILTVMSLIIFPFIAKPIFINLLEIPDNMYTSMLHERKPIIMGVIRKSFVNQSSIN